MIKKQNDGRKFGVCADAVLSSVMHVLFGVLNSAIIEALCVSVLLFVEKRLKECANRVNLDGRCMEKGGVYRI